MTKKIKCILIEFFIIILLLGGIAMGYSQEKPPILGNHSKDNSPVLPGQNPPILHQAAIPPPPQPNENPSVQPPLPGALPTTYANIKVILENLKKALTTAQRARKYFTAGKVWMITAPRGEKEIKGAILYQGIVVAVVQFDPISGEPLPIGYHVISLSSKVSLEYIHQMLDLVVKQLNVINGVEYREPEYSYAIPLEYKGRIISEIKVYYDGIHVVPDYRAQEEMNAFGK